MNIRKFIPFLEYILKFFAPRSMSQHLDIVAKYYDNRKGWMTSSLGKHLFSKYSNTGPPTMETINHIEHKHFNVLIWGLIWTDIHVGCPGVNPLLGCSVNNCKFFEDNATLVPSMDAVVVHLQQGLLPDFTKRKPHQRWIFWTEESPIATFSLAAKNSTPSLTQLADVFNWSMSYRTDSDIPVPYGRTIPLRYPLLVEISNEGLKTLVPHWEHKQTDILVATIMSNCLEVRMQFVKQLLRFLNVDVFGKCGEHFKNHTRRCPVHGTRADCPAISEYIFYIVMENSKCRQYITEKIYHHAYAKGAIPIIVGAPLVDCIKLLPPRSFIHMDNFPSIKHLAREILAISKNMTRLLSYHAWRNHFEVVEEHGYLGTRSLALCRVCEALNYNNNATKVYGRDDLMLYLEPITCCFKNRIWRS